MELLVLRGSGWCGVDDIYEKLPCMNSFALEKGFSFFYIVYTIESKYDCFVDLNKKKSH